MVHDTSPIMALAPGQSWSSALAVAADTVIDVRRDDAQIIDGFLRTGDDDLFGILVQRYKDRVFRLAVSIIGPAAEHEAEDLVQEIFVIVYRKLGTFRGECSFSTWLYRLARNRAIDWRRRQTFPVAGTNGEVVSSVETRCAVNPHEETEASLRMSAILAHVDSLGEPRRTVVFLHYWMGCGVNEISGLIEIPVGTVKSHLFRARRDLARRLGGEASDG